ncbi:unnamed protein product [Prorocentrum cordatum]|uniref:Uncharacterized protein n=1 Tax=Prorocentrum cordatum TaxID=2364126 RepID=A0ABN9YJ65_9DINO|nr:unnamed protein product [Polarella glacialis]
MSCSDLRPHLRARPAASERGSSSDSPRQPWPRRSSPRAAPCRAAAATRTPSRGVRGHLRGERLYLHRSKHPCSGVDRDLLPSHRRSVNWPLSIREGASRP